MKNNKIKIISVFLIIFLCACIITGCEVLSSDTNNSTESSDETKNIFEEYVGQWSGSVDNISLSFNVEPDGTGLYTFVQAGYSESYDFMLEAGTETFSVKIPEDNTLGITKIEGTYSYSDGILTLDVQTSFINGNVFEYTVPCQRS